MTAENLLSGDSRIRTSGRLAMTALDSNGSLAPISAVAVG